MRIDPATQRAKAAALVNLLAPLIEAHFEASEEVAAPVIIHAADSELIDAADKVAQAVADLKQTKYTQREIRARIALERAAVELSARLAELKSRLRKSRSRIDAR